MSRGKLVVLAGLLAGVIAGPAGTAKAAALNVGISPAGAETFVEGSTRSGHIEWFVQEDFQVPSSSTDYHFGFAVTVAFTDPDNVPSDPWLSDLSLTGWPAGFDSTVPWDFEWISSSVDGPRNTWAWWANVTVGPEDARPTFQAGQILANATWSVDGDDVDDVADDSSFHMIAGVQLVYATSPDWLIMQIANDTKLFNPEPIPEPTGLLLLAAGAVAILRRRWGSTRRRASMNSA